MNPTEEYGWNLHGGLTGVQSPCWAKVQSWEGWVLRTFLFWVRSLPGSQVDRCMLGSPRRGATAGQWSGSAALSLQRRRGDRCGQHELRSYRVQGGRGTGLGPCHPEAGSGVSVGIGGLGQGARSLQKDWLNVSKAVSCLTALQGQSPHSWSPSV